MEELILMNVMEVDDLIENGMAIRRRYLRPEDPSFLFARNMPCIRFFVGHILAKDILSDVSIEYASKRFKATIEYATTHENSLGSKMLRRPPINIELKLDDISEYEEMRQQQSKMKQQKLFTEPPSWPSGPKTKQEIYSRVGYVPAEQQQQIIISDDHLKRLFEISDEGTVPPDCKFQHADPNRYPLLRYSDTTGLDFKDFRLES
ncbi:hypothetical protein NQ315_016132 [Exocentrus adspersus]|uniref:Uncharacterized protein n=1 Tax=Exocentrus adspersus TaxID=1586481 RepID=A0AAV8V971_9CUCU|nr:hypothetical protein NQ315_016132 [Exocentrus adspersus]